MAQLVDSKNEETKTPEKTRQYWISELGAAGKGDYDSWKNLSKKIIDKYKAKSLLGAFREVGMKGDARFNVLWSNVQILLPSLYARTPKPDVQRRHKDSDRIARLSAEVLERGIAYEISENRFDDNVIPAILDYLLTGRGVLRVVYEFEESTQIDPQTGQEVSVKSYECAKLKYVHWGDFRHGGARVPTEVGWVAFCSYETRDSLIKRFGEEKGAKIPLDYSSAADATKDSDRNDTLKRAKIWEVWDLDRKQALWISESFDEILDIKENPLGLDSFFPSEVLYATLANDTLIPTPDYVLYQTHAITLDVIQQRIVALLDAIRANGVYNAAHGQDLSNILTQDDGKLFPINNYRDLTDKGGLSGIMEFTPIEQFVSVLNVLYDAGDREIQKIYEVTGISDIMRGSSDPRETAKAQQQKGQFGTVRLSARQGAVQDWLRGLICKIGEIICSHFDAITIRQISGYDLMPGANPQDPMEWEQIYQTLSVDVLRRYKIDIETDSTIAVNTTAEREAWNDYLSATAAFLQTAVQSIQAAPQLAPYFKEALLQTSRAHKAGSGLEDALTSSFDALVESLNQPPQPPPPDPAVEVANIRAEVDREKMQLDSERVQGQLDTKIYQIDSRTQSDMQKMQLEIDRLQKETQIEIEKIKADLMTARMDAQNQKQAALIQAMTASQESSDSSEPSEPSAPPQPIIVNVTAGIPMKKEFLVERDPSTGMMTGGSVVESPIA